MVGLGKLGFPVALAINGRMHDVYGYDINPDVKDWVTGSFPFREDNIEPWLKDNSVQICDTIAEVVENSEIIFVAIQTPHEEKYEGDDILPAERADFNYRYLKQGLYEVVQACTALKQKKIVAVISTCLPGTFNRELLPLVENNDYVQYVYTPQFIAMGNVIYDYLSPEFNLIGVHDEDAAETLRVFYESINSAPSLITDITTAEGIKVSYNTWITAKTVIANAWAEMCEKVGMDFDDMFLAWALSTKRLISTRYMSAGMGDGGGCHPRDNIALSWLSEEAGMTHNLWDDLMRARQMTEVWHARVAAEAAEEHELPLVILGRAFKPETDIEVGSPAKLMANILIRMGQQFTHVNDLDYLPPAVYFIATQNDRYATYEFPSGSVVIDPFGYIDDREGVTVNRLGRL